MTEAVVNQADLPTITPLLVKAFGLCVGIVVANLYYAQPIIELIAPNLGLSSGAASLIVSLTQIGYAAGLFLFVPLGDLLENKRLILIMVLVTAVRLTLAATAQRQSVFLAASALIGLTSVSVQILVPLAAHMSPEEIRGRVVGNVMGGLLIGILLSRPISSVVTDMFGWRAIFAAGAVAMLVVAAIVTALVPKRQPVAALSYGQLLGSLLSLLKDTAILRRRAFYQANVFAAFTLFWTAVPIELARAHAFSQSKIALFSLIGAAGAVSGPLGGRLADAGRSRLGTFVALWGVTIALFLSATPLGNSVFVLAACAIVIDFCVQLNLVIGQRNIYQLPAHHRGRLTALYMTSVFIGGSIGSAIASGLYAFDGWTSVALVAAAFPLLAAMTAMFWEREG
jgi:predicted MFS family arabinose efflux permease